ncbi:hypothetical protein ACOMHN_045173 [Nucella lapillus]
MSINVSREEVMTGEMGDGDDNRYKYPAAYPYPPNPPSKYPATYPYPSNPPRSVHRLLKPYLCTLYHGYNKYPATIPYPCNLLCEYKYPATIPYPCNLHMGCPGQFTCS